MVDASRLRNAIALAGFRSSEQFAKAVGLDGSKLCKIMDGTRQTKAPEVVRMCVSLRLAPAAMLEILTGLELA